MPLKATSDLPLVTQAKRGRVRDCEWMSIYRGEVFFKCLCLAIVFE